MDNKTKQKNECVKETCRGEERFRDRRETEEKVGLVVTRIVYALYIYIHIYETVKEQI